MRIKLKYGASWRSFLSSPEITDGSLVSLCKTWTSKLSRTSHSSRFLRSFTGVRIYPLSSKSIKASKWRLRMISRLSNLLSKLLRPLKKFTLTSWSLMRGEKSWISWTKLCFRRTSLTLFLSKRLLKSSFQWSSTKWSWRTPQSASLPLNRAKNC